MVDQATIQLEKYYQKILSQEGLGIYRANPWERNRPFNPEELERLVLPEKMQALGYSSSLAGPDRTRTRSYPLSFLRSDFGTRYCQKTQSFPE
jgi:hypothetical protein